MLRDNGSGDALGYPTMITVPRSLARVIWLVRRRSDSYDGRSSRPRQGTASTRIAITAHDGRTDAHGHDEQLPGAGPGGRERPRAPGPLRRRAPGAGGGPSLPQRTGPDAGHALLGPAPAVRGGQDGAARRPRPDRRARRRRRGYLGRRLRPDRTGRHPAGQPGPLSRRPDRRHARRGVPAGPARADLRDHRLAVPAVQHALSAPGDGAVELAAPRGRPRRC